MTKNDDIYRKLRKHLDRQPVGFPKTVSGVEIKVLKHIFTPEEARVALILDYRFVSLDIIYEKQGNPGYSKEALKKILDRIAKKGGIGYRTRNGRFFYCNMPLVVGMYEGFLKHLNEEFIRDFGKYTSSPSFGISFIGTAVPQMRTIPVEQVLPLDTRSAALTRYLF